MHTSWAVSADWNEVGLRSRAGNQSPVYPWIVKAVEWTLGNAEPRFRSSKQSENGTESTEWSSSDGGSRDRLLYTDGWTEVVLRIPSLLAFGATVFLGVWICRQQENVARSRFQRVTEPAPSGSWRGSWTEGLLATLAISLLLGLDRIQVFYATEARVYALLQLLSLLGWWCVHRLAQPFHAESCSSATMGSGRDHCRKMPSGMIYVWTLVAVLMIYLHLIAVVVLLVQAVVIVCVCYWRGERILLLRFMVCLLALGCVALPAGWLGLPVWERRSQWNRFAGDASLTTLLDQFPLLPILVPVVVAKVLDLALRWFGVRSSTEKEASQLDSDRTAMGYVEQIRGFPLWLWAVAFLGPLLLGWALTAFEIAPMMHRRYLLASSVPLSLLAVSVLGTVRIRWLALTALLASVGWLITYQPTLDVWRSGQLVGVLRGEDWRGASQWIARSVKSEDEIWCGSDLIEGDGLELPLDDAMDRYLAFPLSGHYSIPIPSEGTSDRDRERSSAMSEKEIIRPRALLSNAGLWLQQWFSARENPGTRSLFVIVRAPAEDLASVMNAILEQQLPPGMELSAIGPVRRFGMLSGMRLEIARPEL